MKKKINALHIASFVGNIGDMANHKGFKWLRDKFLDFEFNITEKEIREFYWKKWKFNSNEFIQEANRYDLIVIGGGNYFELWVNDSSTGTSVDINKNVLSKIETPILFYALGCDVGQGVTKENVKKFEEFLDLVTNDSRYFVSVRNDGAISNIEKIYGDKYKNKIVKIPDGGFFTDIDDMFHYEIEKDCKNIVINLAGDMQETRFSANGISYREFINKFTKVLEKIYMKYEENINFIFVPHIFRDLETIYDVINCMNDEIRRKKVKVAPYLTGILGHDYIFSLYNQADLILATRFHANVCSYALNKNVIGLCNYMQIHNLYQEVDSKEYIEITKKEFDTELLDMVNIHFKYSKDYINNAIQVKQQLQLEAKETYQLLNNWLKNSI